MTWLFSFDPAFPSVALRYSKIRVLRSPERATNWERIPILVTFLLTPRLYHALL